MAVYTHVDEEDVEAFVAAYDIGAVVAFKGIAEGVENSNYLLQTERGNFILTLYEKRVAEGDLPFFLNLMRHLNAGGIPCPTPVAGRDGQMLRRLGGRPAAIVTFLQGLSVTRIQPEHCAALGAALAEMHCVGTDFDMTRPNDLSVAGWRRLVEATVDRADEVRPGLGQDIANELAVLEQIWPDGLPTGVIHADLFPDNVFFRGGRLSGIIDFYFACTDSLAYDLTICLNAWCFERDYSFNVTKARHLLASYAQVRPLTREELEALPVLARGNALRFLLTRLYDWLNQPEGALVTPKDPLEYLHKLRFHRSVRSVAAYGLD